MDDSRSTNGDRLTDDDLFSDCDLLTDGGDLSTDNAQVTDGDKVLDDSLLFLSRWDLDSLAMVSRRFLAACQRGADKTPFMQRRTLDRVCITKYLCGLFIDSTLHMEQLAKGVNRCIFIGPHYDKQTSRQVELDLDQLELLLEAESNMRARRCTLVTDGELATTRELAKKSSSLWKSGELKVRCYPNTTRCDLAAEDFAGCSSFKVHRGLDVLGDLDVHWQCPQQANIAAPLPSCPQIKLGINTRCHGIDYSSIVDFLFAPPANGTSEASGARGQTRELRIYDLVLASIPNDDYQCWTELKALIQSRLDSLKADPQPFLLQIRTLMPNLKNYEDPLAEEILVPSQLPTPAERPGPSNATQSPPPSYPKCEFRVLKIDTLYIFIEAMIMP